MIGLLGALAVFLLLLVVFLIARTSEISAMLKGDADDYTRASRISAYGLMAFMIGGFILTAWSCAVYIPRMLPKAASEHGVMTDNLFNVTLFFTGVVFVITQILLFWFAFKYRQRKDGKAFFFPHNNTMELVWTTIPAIVMTVLVVMGLRTWYFIFPDQDEIVQIEAAPESVLSLEVIGKQFNWIVRYPGEDLAYGERVMSAEYVSSMNELGVDFEDPASHDDIWNPDTIYFVKNKPVFVKLGALDVIHSFYLPHFRVKMDCVPGLPTSFKFTPTMTTTEMRDFLSEKKEWQKLDEAGRPRYETFMYELACTELCGKSHFAMQKYVMVVEQDQYDKWLDRQKSYYETVIQPSMAQNEEPAQLDEAIETDDEHTIGGEDHMDGEIHDGEEAPEVDEEADATATI